MRNLLLAISTTLVIISACNTSEPSKPGKVAIHQSINAISSLEIAEDLDIRLFASEPQLLNPTNIDVDHKGRVWICEGYNYRNPLNPDNPYKEEGDRIVIVEDSNGDGVADKQKVYYQGKDVNAALGIAVLGNKVFISRSPYVLVFIDDDNDDLPDRRDTLFSGIEGIHHDHSVHAITFGPDGKLYFNFGNEANRLLDKKGNQVIDIHGYPVLDNGNPYREGMVFRCNPDGSEVEILAHNFRNNYELAVDSYGSIWQSDNDDDGNRGVRINFILSYGNYGYKDEKTGAGWRTYRTGMADDIPSRHWHQHDPGVVPNLIQTGAGSPTGILVYEGELLPERYHNQIIHADAGPRVVRAYPVTARGAGYIACQDTLVYSVNDLWFRPTDVCTAPDGSILISDWYDPGVGGHLIEDFEKGRIFRLSPNAGKYQIPEYNYNTPEGAVEALANPSQSVRYLAWTSLAQMGELAEAALLELWNDENPRFRARALWLLARIPGKTETYITKGLSDPNAEIRLCAFRAATQLQPDKKLDYISQLVGDTNFEVLREAAIALRFETGPRAAALWTRLAVRYTGNDRWYLEALGIGADLQANLFFEAWLDEVGENWNKGNNKDIVWRIRANEAIPLLTHLIEEESETSQLDRYFRAFDFHDYHLVSKHLTSLLLSNRHSLSDYIKRTALTHIQDETIQSTPTICKVMENIITATSKDDDYLNLTQQRWSSLSPLFKQQQMSRLKNMIYQAAEKDLQIRSINLLLNIQEGSNWLRAQLTQEGRFKKKQIQQLMGFIESSVALNLLEKIIIDQGEDKGDRQAAIQIMAQSWRGSYYLLDMIETDKLENNMVEIAAAQLVSKGDSRLRNKAMAYLPEKTSASVEIAPISELVNLDGDLVRGKQVFTQYCSVCHQVNGEGINFGPNLSEIGNKLSKEGLFTAIMYPNAGINFGYEGYVVLMHSGDLSAGYIESQEKDFITIRQNGGLSRKIAKQEISKMETMERSLMPEGLDQVIGQQGLIDLITYLTSLKQQKLSAR